MRAKMRRQKQMEKFEERRSMKRSQVTTSRAESNSESIDFDSMITGVVKEVDHIGRMKISRPKIKKNQKKKPAWAQSSVQLEQENKEEENDLLDYMDNLDYDKFIGDMEVKTIVSMLKEKVQEMEKLKELKKKKNDFTQSLLEGNYSFVPERTPVYHRH